MTSKSIIVDLDGTLCNIDHRLHHIKGERKDWDAFFAGIMDDSVNEWCVEIVTGMQKMGAEILFITGRMWKYEDVTHDWIKHIAGIRHWSLFMREDGDYRPDWEVKQDIYRLMIMPYDNVLFALDDRQQVVDMWRRNGVTCLQCAKGDY